MSTINIIILSLSSLLLIFVGIMRLSNPIKTYERNSGIKLPNDTDLLNEIRGLSALQLGGGIFMVLGIFMTELSFTSHMVAALIFLGFALGRVISIAADGKPNKQLVSGISFELMLGAANVYGLVSI